ncbi:MAG: hypothetical protein LBR91_03905 [Puniceicoccales bacterium]|nr:hypothetical protein [Puniceicoccales bacterium]
MFTVIFSDVDDITRQHLANNKINSLANCVLFAERLNELPTDVTQRCSDAEIISTFVYSRLSADVLENFKNLKLISTRSTGYNNVDLDYCKAHGIKVANVSGYGEITVAEYAVGLMLSLTRKIGFSNNKLRNGVVNVGEDMGIDLSGKTVGVIGTGAIGRHFAKLCRAFGCNILAHDPFPNQKLIDEGVCTYVPMDDLLGSADIIALHCPSTKENYHFVNKETIEKMKDGVFLVNTARGELISPIDFYEAIVAGKISGAGLDVLDYEDVIIKDDVEVVKNSDKSVAITSLVNAKLLQLPNVIVTPHIAFNSSDAVRRILNSSIDTITDFISGKNVTSVI